MLAPTGFNSWRGYFSFSFAREFADPAGETLGGATHLEKIGSAVASALLGPLDWVVREFRNPLVIVALTVTLLFLTSVIFYPAQTFMLAARIFPFIRYVHAGHIKAALFIIFEAVILGLGLRTYGRLSNNNLMSQLRNRQAIPVPIGAVKIPK